MLVEFNALIFEGEIQSPIFLGNKAIDQNKGGVAPRVKNQKTPITSPILPHSELTW